MELAKLIQKYKSVALLGMCKNAGKTTALNHLISKFNHQILGLTSIGRDGESTDVVTATKKPPIFVAQNTLFATASLLLHKSTTTNQILYASGMSTPLGEVIVVRALSDGFVELAGPSTTDQLVQIKQQLFRLGAQRVFIDGALSRKSVHSAADAIILSTGASYHKNFQTVVQDTIFLSQLFCLPIAKIPSEILLQLSQTTALDQDFLPINCKNEQIFCADGAKYIYISGALTDSLLAKFIKASKALDDKILIVDDAGKILISPQLGQQFFLKGGKMELVNQTPLVAITANPVAAYGYSFDKNALINELSSRLAVPIFDVLRGDDK